MTNTRRLSRMALATLAATTPLLLIVAPLTVSAASGANALPTLVINEVDASGVPQDWVELKNTGSLMVDASGLILTDDKATDRFDIPVGTMIAPGGYASFDVADAFGLGKGGDSARLYLGDTTTLVDSFTWGSNSSPSTWGRCPDGTGGFALTSAATKNATNECGTPIPTPAPSPSTPPTAAALAWPGGDNVTSANEQNFFGTNLSGLFYEHGAAGSDTLWAVRNGPSTLYSLKRSGTNWVPSNAGDWKTGKSLTYPDGTGDPDAEGVTRSPDGLFVSTERNNNDKTVSRPSVLKFDETTPGTTLAATMEWNLTSDLPTLGANLGAEGITFVPDSYLTAQGFLDEKTGLPYSPARYPNHGSGLFFVGIEGNGTIYAYALDQTDGAAFTRVATIASGFPAVMELQYDQEKSAIWAVCDNTCNGQYALLDVAKTGADAGRFAVKSVYHRPVGMGNFNNEGFVTAPQSRCENGVKPVIWADDDEDNGYSLREGTIDCAAAATGSDSTGSGSTGSAGAAGTGSGGTMTVPAAGAASPQLAATGADPSIAAGAGLLMLVAGGIAVTFGRRRTAV